MKLYSIHGFPNKVAAGSVPLSYILMTGKTTKDYMLLVSLPILRTRVIIIFFMFE